MSEIYLRTDVQVARILVIDDEKEILVLLQQLLVAAGHEVFPLLRADRVMEQLVAVAPDLVITDIMMPGVTGGTVYSAIREQVGPNLPVIVSTGFKMKLRAEDPLLAYCPKPLDPELLLDTVQRLLRLSGKSSANGNGKTPDA